MTLPPNTPARPPQRKFSAFGTPWPLDLPQLRVRVRYITARFLQMPEPRISLRNTDEILRWIKQLRDDGLPRSAAELARLAIEEEPEQRLLWLYLLGQAVEDDNATEFTDLAALFHKQFPNDSARAQIERVRLGFSYLTSEVTTGSFASPTAWTAAALLGRDDTAQRTLHALLLRVAATGSAP